MNNRQTEGRIEQNSALLTNRATRLCKWNGVVDLLKHTPPHVLPCPIWSFCVKGCSYIRENHQNSGALELPSLRMGGVADPKIHAPPHTCYHVKLGGTPKIGKCFGSAPCRRGIADPFVIHPPPHVLSCRIWSFQIKQYERH